MLTSSPTRHLGNRHSCTATPHDVGRVVGESSFRQLGNNRGVCLAQILVELSTSGRLWSGFGTLHDSARHPHVADIMPGFQFVDTARRQTEAATTLVRRLISWCRDEKKSFYVFFVDLVKAFDQVVPETPVGNPLQSHRPHVTLDLS